MCKDKCSKIGYKKLNEITYVREWYSPSSISEESRLRVGTMDSPGVPINVGVRYSIIHLLVYIFTLASLYVLSREHRTHTLITTLPYKAT